ncbi:N-acetyltransferase [Bacteroidales bacterium]|nr:N-acetyltransferase [Bacteroidales bacterium]
MERIIILERAAKSHFPIIKEIAYDTWPDTFGGILSEQQISYMLVMMYDLESLAHQTEVLGHQFILLKEQIDGQDKYWGYAAYELNCKEDTCKIHKIYLLPKCQGMGFGKRLLGYVEKESNINKNKFLTLNVNKYNKAVDFYLKYGFQIVGEEEIDIGNGFLMEDYVMRK